MYKAIAFDFFNVVFVQKGWNWGVDDELAEFIEKLHANYKIALVSNSSKASARAILKDEGAISAFDEIIVSGEVGVSKPHPKIFQLTAEKLGLDPAEIIFVDDSAYNTDGAEAAGMKAVVYTGLNDLKSELSKLGIK